MPFRRSLRKPYYKRVGAGSSRYRPKRTVGVVGVGRRALPYRGSYGGYQVHAQRNIVPNRMKMQHVWESPFTLTNNSGTNSNQLQLALNNLDVPYNDVTGTTWTNQKQLSVQFFDQMQTLYDAYTVYRADVEILVNNSDTNPVLCAITTANTADAVSSSMLATNIASRPGASQFALTAASGSKCMKRLKRKYWMHKLNGYKGLSKYLEDTGNINPTNTSSTTQSQFLTYSFSKLAQDALPTSATLSGYVRITYHTLWRDRQPIIDQANLG